MQIYIWNICSAINCCNSSDNQVLRELYIQAILMSGRWHKRLNRLIEFWNSVFLNFCFNSYWYLRLLLFRINPQSVVAYNNVRFFQSTFQQPVNASKNSTLNWVIKYSFFMIFVLGKLLRDFSFYSPIFVSLWFRYLQTCMDNSCIYLSSQLFFQSTHKTLKIPRKIAATVDKNVNKHGRVEVSFFGFQCVKHSKV